MHEEIEQANRATEERYGRQLAACRHVRDFVHELTRPWQGRSLDPKNRHDLIVTAMFARSFTTFWAAVELVHMGFGEQAAMLNRSLFEDMVDVHWVCTEPDRAVELYEAHLEHGKMLLADQIAKYPDFYPAEKIPEFNEEDRKRLDGIFGPHGTKSWTTLNLYERVCAIEHFWEDEPNKQILRFFRDIPHRENNQTLHVTAYGLTSLVRAHDERGITLKLGPGSEMLDRALYASYWVFLQIVGLIVDHFNFDVSEERRGEVFSRTAFVELDAKTMRATGRNDPCPCGSGQKFKRCHGA